MSWTCRSSKCPLLTSSSQQIYLFTGKKPRMSRTRTQTEPPSFNRTSVIKQNLCNQTEPPSLNRTSSINQNLHQNLLQNLHLSCSLPFSSNEADISQNPLQQQHSGSVVGVGCSRSVTCSSCLCRRTQTVPSPVQTPKRGRQARSRKTPCFTSSKVSLFVFPDR